MAYSEEIIGLIKRIAKVDKDLAEKILLGDLDAIRSLGQGNVMSPDEILDAFDNKKTKELVEKAKFLCDKIELYNLLIVSPLVYGSSNKTKGGK